LYNNCKENNENERMYSEEEYHADALKDEGLIDPNGDQLKPFRPVINVADDPTIYEDWQKQDWKKTFCGT
jgi:hypothetical protein